MFDAGLYANGLQERVRVVSCALSDGEGMLDFNYQALGPVSSASQFGHRRVPGSGDEFVPVASEMVCGSRVDHLVETGVIRAPTLVKTDVDGNELAILRGMTGLLRGRQRPRAVQVRASRDASCGWVRASRWPDELGAFDDVRRAGSQRSLRSDGNKITSRMLGESVSSITRRSMPIPQPPVGGMPISRARMKSAS